MKPQTRFVGLDGHSQSVTVAIGDEGQSVLDEYPEGHSRSPSARGTQPRLGHTSPLGCYTKKRGQGGNLPAFVKLFCRSLN
jgi:hypothetical protein